MVPLRMYAAHAMMLSCGGPAEARADYLQSADGFQAAVGFRGRRGTTTMRLDGMFTAVVTFLFLQTSSDWKIWGANQCFLFRRSLKLSYFNAFHTSQHYVRQTVGVAQARDVCGVQCDADSDRARGGAGGCHAWDLKKNACIQRI